MSSCVCAKNHPSDLFGLVAAAFERCVRLWRAVAPVNTAKNQFFQYNFFHDKGKSIGKDVS